jgi:hypothetical protein
MLTLLVGGCAARGIPVVDVVATTDGAIAPHDLAIAAPDLTSATVSAAPCMTGGNVLYLDGDPGAYIFSGVQTLAVMTWIPLSGDIDTFWYESSPGGWDVTFSSKELGRELAVGRYDNAMCYPFATTGRPGFDISGNGRRCNNEIGWFEILSIGGASANHSWTELTATFEQHCESGAPALRGCIHFEN